MANIHQNAAAKCSLALWVFIAVMTNFDYSRWTVHMELWTQFRILASDCCIISTFAIIFALTG